ncbi:MULTISPECIES: nuclear transport factor 2 family protein [Thermomonosporaceae]|uniref:nuclear transport factor 2 family protein n=1 Tax=Thermomonosporaceae TaxID=2012 RepID=UPI00255B3CD9|nr:MULTISPECIES: nuclear transport factor 2 family protein [Thermomonosporaceae]MDL4773394.1 nuclear transport factor 2 family protein [Actinomadura xylanilytica]
MSTSLAVLKRFYAAEAEYLTSGGPGKADFGGMAKCLDPEVTLHQAASLPYGGTWRGHAGMERFMATMSELWASLEFVDQRFATEGDTVVAYNRAIMCSRATGRSLDASIVQWITIKDGLVAEFRPYYLDTAEVIATLTP